jgi:hypothetical protein
MLIIVYWPLITKIYMLLTVFWSLRFICFLLCTDHWSQSFVCFWSFNGSTDHWGLYADWYAFDRFETVLITEVHTCMILIIVCWPLITQFLWLWAFTGSTDHASIMDKIFDKKLFTACKSIYYDKLHESYLSNYIYNPLFVIITL